MASELDGDSQAESQPAPWSGRSGFTAAAPQAFTVCLGRGESDGGEAVEAKSSIGLGTLANGAVRLALAWRRTKGTGLSLGTFDLAGPGKKEILKRVSIQYPCSLETTRMSSKRKPTV